MRVAIGSDHAGFELKEAVKHHEVIDVGTSHARRVTLVRASDGALEPKRRTIDLFFQDAPSIMWLVSEDEASLVGPWEPLTKEEPAADVRRQDADLLNRSNAVLAGWKGDRCLEAVLQQWLPYRRRP